MGKRIVLFLEIWVAALSRVRLFYLAAFILFPTLTNLIPHVGSTFLALLAFSGLPFIMSSGLRPPLQAHEKRVMWAFAGYSAVYLLSFIINGLTGNLPDLQLRDLGHEIRFLAIMPIFFLFRHLKIRQATLWAGVIGGALLSGGYAVLSYFWLFPGERVSGSYHSIAFGDLSLTLAFMSIPALDYFMGKPKGYRFLPPAALALGIIASISSETRGAWIAIPLLTCILFYYSASIFKIGVRFIFLSVILLSLSAAYQIPATNVSGRIHAVYKELSDYHKGDRTYTSVATRIEGWLVALEIFWENPVIGAGPGSYESLMHRMLKQGKRYEIAAVHSQPHGAYPSAMSDCGILGLAALLGLFLSPLGSAVRVMRHQKKLRHLGYALMILVIGFMHFGLTETIFSRNINLTFYIILTAFIMAATANEQEACESRPATGCPEPVS
ncbi:MAG: O-antigen ligase family protein [Desulfobacteraceae bacterium]|nr:MAG: O-antigen ligase family protein [Desulfobacteraceae bacterium]